MHMVPKLHSVQYRTQKENSIYENLMKHNCATTMILYVPSACKTCFLLYKFDCTVVLASPK